MSKLKPFYIKSLLQMRKELGRMSKGDLTYHSLEQLLPKYRDGLVGSGAYNDISRLLSGNQYVADPDHLDALRFEVLRKVNAAIASMDDQQDVDVVLVQNLPRLPDVEPTRPKATSLRAVVFKFPRRWREDFVAQGPIKQSTIVLGVLASLWGAITYYETWLIPSLQYLHIIDRPHAAKERHAATVQQLQKYYAEASQYQREAAATVAGSEQQYNELKREIDAWSKEVGGLDS